MTETETHTETDTNTDEQSSKSVSRRAYLTGVAGLGAAGVFAAGRASAQTAPEGTVGTPTNPYLVAYIDRMNFSARTTDPSSPDDGELWYRSDL